MAYRSLLKHRCFLWEMRQGQVDGSPVHTWERVETPYDLPLRCFLDLNFIRKGKDPIWTPEAGRPADRSGVLFLAGDAPVRSGQRVEMVKGPEGTFSIEGAVDEAWKPSRRHHLEIGVLEVATSLTRPMYASREVSGG